MSTNQAQIDCWNGASGKRWVMYQERLDRSFAPIDAFGLTRAAPKQGERVVDVGCGCGATTVQLAERVGPTGRILGVDISAPMLALARKRTEPLPWVSLAEADASLHRFAGDADLIYSRFGSMFFADPISAFSNLRTALRPEGRICIVCWRSTDDNAWYQVPMRAAETVVDALPPTEPGAPGPFAFADEGRLRSVLTQAGFNDVQIERCDTPICFSTTGLDEAVVFAIHAGPVARMMVDANAEIVERVRAAVSKALRGFLREETLSLSASVWVATARR